MLKILSSLILIFLFMACANAPIEGNESAAAVYVNEIDWPVETKKNLDLLRQTVQEMHPAFVVKKELPEREFLNWFEKGYQQALTRVYSVKDFPGLYFNLRAYTVGFEDEHLLLGLSSPDVFRKQIPLKWPGFVVTNDGKSNFLVKFVDEESAEQAPPKGARLKSCDGVDTKKLLAKNVFPYFGSSKIQKNWNQFGPRLFVDMGNPFIQIPKSCVFISNNSEKEYQLIWRNIAFDDIWGKLSLMNPNPKAEIHSFGSDSAWISLPTFAPDNEIEKDLRKIFSELPKYRSGRRIVIDLRGNTGGSSSWGSEVLKSLFTNDFVSKVDQNVTSGEIYEYRVNKVTNDYFANLLGDSSKNIKKDNDFFSLVSTEIQRGLQEGHQSIRIPMTKFQNQPNTSAKNPVKAKVFVVTDEMCFSACLSFMDAILQIPGVVHIGRTTSADTVFMQTTNEFSLANGNLSFSVPVLRIHNRLRKHNQPYKPAVTYQGDISNTSALEKWVLKL